VRLYGDAIYEAPEIWRDPRSQAGIGRIAASGERLTKVNSPRASRGFYKLAAAASSVPLIGRRNPLLRLPAAEDNAAMEAEPSNTNPPKRKLRWFQFSLAILPVTFPVPFTL
jgi:hypothetical protein